MKELFYKIAQQIVEEEISLEAGIEKIKDVKSDRKTWEIILKELPEYSVKEPQNSLIITELIKNWASIHFSEEDFYESIFWEGHCALILGDLDRTLSSINLLYKYYEEKDKNKFVNYCLKYGDTCFSLGRLAIALEYYQKGFDNCSEKNETYCRSLWKKAIINQNLGKLEQAFEEYDKSYKLSIKLELEDISYEIFQSKIELYKEIKPSDFIIKSYEEMLSFLEEKDNKKLQGIILSQMSKYVYEQGEKEKAIECLENSITLLEEFQSAQEISELMTLLGNIYKESGKFQEAISCFEKSREILRQGINTKKQKKEEWAPDIIEEDEKEILDYKKVLKEAQEEENNYKICTILHSLGNAYCGLGKLDHAMKSWTDSLEIAEKIENIELIFQNHYRLGLLSIKRGDLENGREAMIKGIETLESIRKYLPTRSFNFIEKHIGIFSEVITCSILMNNIISALHFLEQELRWKFLTPVGDKILLERANLPEDLKAEYLTILDKLHRTYSDLEENLIDNKKEDIPWNSFKDYKNRLEELKTQIEILDSEWASVFGSQFLFDPNAIQKELAEGTIIIQTFTNDEATFLILIDRNYIDLIKIDGLNKKYTNNLYKPLKNIEEFINLYEDIRLEEKIGDAIIKEKLKEKIAQYKWKNIYEATESWKLEMDTALKSLSDLILPKLFPILEEKAIDRLIFIPYAELQLFPLHLLPILEDEEDELIYLQDRYEVTYSPSSSFLAKNQKQLKEINNKIFLIGYKNGYLPFLEQELTSIQMIWPGEFEKYTLHEDDIIEVCDKLKDFNYVHFSNFSTTNYPDPFSSSIYFKLDKGAEKSFNFRTIDILGRLFLDNTKVITLSSNERLIEKLSPNGDFMGLFHAFLYAGAQTVIASMWSKPDIINFLFIEKFYHGLGQGLRPVMALQEAQNKIKIMKVKDIYKRLNQLQRFLPEDKARILKSLCLFFEGKLEKLSLDDKKEVLAILQIPRDPIFGNLKNYKGIEIKDFIDSESEELEGEGNYAWDYTPFNHPYFWGGYCCYGVGFTEIIEDTQEQEEELSVPIYIEEFSFPDEDTANKEIETAISNITEEGIKEFETVKSQIKENPILKEEVKSKKKRVKVRCPHCGNKIRCILSVEGGKARCPTCKGKIRVSPKSSPFDDIRIPAICPHCCENIHCFLPMAGRRAKCPKCKGKVRIPKRDILLAEIAAGDSNSSILLLND